jgi:hypothetical protein
MARNFAQIVCFVLLLDRRHRRVIRESQCNGYDSGTLVPSITAYRNVGPRGGVIQGFAHPIKIELAELGARGQQQSLCGAAGSFTSLIHRRPCVFQGTFLTEIFPGKIEARATGSVALSFRVAHHEVLQQPQRQWLRKIGTEQPIRLFSHSMLQRTICPLYFLVHSG